MKKGHWHVALQYDMYYKRGTDFHLIHWRPHDVHIAANNFMMISLSLSPECGIETLILSILYCVVNMII